jgi:hypothetical protein
MATDDRRDLQIRERAGLEESLINQDFKEVLQRWGGTVITIVAVAALGYLGFKKWNEYKQTQIKDAFAQLNTTLESASPSPTSLIGVALDHADVPAVAAVARLHAADAYLNIVRRGIKEGAALNADGTLADPADVLSPEDREANLKLAAENYQLVLTYAGSDPAKSLDAIGALYGLAAVAESRGKLDEAKANYELIIALSKPWGEGGHAKLAQERIDSLLTLASIPALPEKAMVPTPLNTTPAAPVAATPEAGLNLGGAATQPAPVPEVIPAAPIETVPTPAPAPTTPTTPSSTPEEPKKP